MGFMPAQVLLTAIELQVFEVLTEEDRGLTAQNLRQRLNLPTPSTTHLLEALVGMGLLAVKDGRYTPTSDAAVLTDPRWESFRHDLLRDANRENFHYWAELADIMRGHRQPSMFASIDRDPAQLTKFVKIMAAASQPAYEKVAHTLDLRSVRTVLDLGGAAGALALTLHDQHPHLQITTFDRPAMTSLAADAIAQAGAAKRIRALSGDFLTDPIPQADVIVTSMVLLDWPTDVKTSLIRRIYDALLPGGRFIALDRMDPEAIPAPSREGLIAQLDALDKLVHFGDAYHFTHHELQMWCAEAGFASYTAESLHDDIWMSVAQR